MPDPTREQEIREQVKSIELINRDKMVYLLSLLDQSRTELAEVNELLSTSKLSLGIDAAFRQEAVQTRKELMEARKNLQTYATQLLNSATDITCLTEALEKYGKHTTQCADLRDNALGHGQMPRCLTSCGLTTALGQ